MSYTRSQHFEPGTFLRSCDICGIRFRANELRKGDDGFWRCTRWCQEIPAITRDRISAASQKRVEAPPPPHGIPFDQLETYGAEAVLFDFLATHPIMDANWPGGSRYGAAPTGNIAANGMAPSSTAYSFQAAAETCRYLYDLINEGKRPTRWITAAKTKLRELADWILSKQNTTGSADTNMAYGGFDLNTIDSTQLTATYGAQDNAGCGIALLFAWLVFGENKYIAGARLTAHMIRALQWSAYATTFFTSSDGAGIVRLYTGGHSSRLKFNTAQARLVFDSNFSLEDLLSTEFLVRLRAADGDATYGGLGNSGTQSFVTTSAATLSSMITDALNFWSAGTLDVTVGAIITGLSATTPRQFFNSFPTTKPGSSNGSGSWQYNNGLATGTEILSFTFAVALRSLHYVSGYNTQVASVWTWLMSFSSNPAFIGDAGTLPTDFSIATTTKSANPPTPPTAQGNVIAPSYNPKLALSLGLLLRDSANAFAPVLYNEFSQYDWRCAGLMAAIQVSQNAGDFRKAKDALSTGRLRRPVQWMTSGDNAITDYAFLMQLTGLAFQPTSTVVFWRTIGAAQCGAVFRYQPQGWTGTQAPGMTPGVRV